MKPRRRAAAGICAVLCATLLGLTAAACSGSSGGTSAQGKSAEVDSAAGGAASASSAGSAAAASAPEAKRNAMAGSAADDGKTTSRLTSAPGALIITASLSVDVAAAKDVTPAANRARLVAVHAGGRVDSDDRSTSTSAPTAALTLRVPNAAVPATLNELSALGTPVSRELQTKDVTQELVDVTSRVASARAAIASLNGLYAKAKSVRDVITIETTLAQREADLESMQAQQTSLTRMTALATVSLSLQVRAHHKVVHHQHKTSKSTFLTGLSGGWHAFTTTLRAIGTAFGAALPFLAVLAAVVVVAVLGRRSMLHRRREVAAAGAGAGGPGPAAGDGPDLTGRT